MHYACIIGVNHEWPEQRKSLGDIGLARCLSRHCGLPKRRLVEIYDQFATRSNVLYSLEQLLNIRNENPTEDDTLLLYYGGHGKAEEVCTYTESIVDGRIQHEPWLRYDEIVDLLETTFRGGTVWVIVDCCHSGGFGKAVMQRYHDSNNTLNVNYGCIMSVPPGDTAGEEWTMTECFIRAFKGELLCSANASSPYYLSTRKGKHRIKLPQEIVPPENQPDPSKSQPFAHPSWGQVIEFLANEMGRVKGNQLTTLFCGHGMNDGTILTTPCVFAEQFTSMFDPVMCSSEQGRVGGIPRDDSWMVPFVQNAYSVHDEIYIKWTGPLIGSIYNAKSCSNVGSYVIGWLPARIISISDSIACIDVRDVITGNHWTIEVPIGEEIETKNTLLSGLPFGFHLKPQQCVNAVTHLAKQLCYIDASLCPNTRLQILWTDGKFYPGTVLCPEEVVWDNVEEHEVDDHYFVAGPYAPVKWEEEDTTSLVPLGKCVVVNNRHKSFKKNDLVAAQVSVEKSIRQTAKHIDTPEQAMFASLSCSGRKLHPSHEPISNSHDAKEEDCNEWEAYDAEDCEYLPVHIMNDVKRLPLEVLAYHMCYRQSGSFSVVFWKEDSVLSLVPNTFLRLRLDNENECNSDSSDSSNDDDECSEANTTDSNLAPVAPSIDSFEVGSSWWVANQRFARVTLLLSAAFTLGYLLGNRKRI
ncbi:hypothetical protein HJC23_004782 [Cyclotella cryptica]|uniref:Peptidase C14 caspase domain-containing protein n=1 Tax=Cyclotella cryptica TaxID=29204 RepID=A0ABD3PYB6_9STRA|eukprot:CCRYP_010398-RA/>CCRYP_010398-RA protein AED:0.00 eAED:0.00 QI:267/-1/1/1/-1/1/1/266/693